MDFADVSLYENYYVGVYNIPKTKYTSFDLYLRPLSTTVWFCILLIIVTASIVLSARIIVLDPHFKLFLSKCSKTECSMVLYRHFINNLFLVSSTLIGQSYVLTTITKKGQRNVIFGILFMFCIILVTVFVSQDYIISYRFC